MIYFNDDCGQLLRHFLRQECLWGNGYRQFCIVLTVNPIVIPTMERSLIALTVIKRGLFTVSSTRIIGSHRSVRGRMPGGRAYRRAVLRSDSMRFTVASNGGSSSRRIVSSEVRLAWVEMLTAAITRSRRSRMGAATARRPSSSS